MPTESRWTAVCCVVALALLAGCSAAQKEPPKTADGVVTAFAADMKANRPEVAWDLMPPSYQKDVNEVVAAAVAKVDPELHAEGWSVVRKAVALAKSKKDIILKLPVFADPKAPVKADELAKNWDTVIALLDTVANSELSDLSKLKNPNVRAILAGTGAKLMGQVQQLLALLPPEQRAGNPWDELATMKASLVKAEGDKATVKIEVKGRPEEVPFTRVEGRWIPADMAASWKQDIGDFKKRIANEPAMDAQKKIQVMGMIKGVNAALETLDKAKTPEEFSAALGPAFAPIGMMIMGQMMGGMGQPGGTPPMTPPPGINGIR